MALKVTKIKCILPFQLTQYLQDPNRKVRVIDCRSFLEFNDNHIVGAINVCCSKLIKRRLQQDKITLKDLLLQCRIDLEEITDLVLYDQKTCASEEMLPDSFIYVLVKKLSQVFDGVAALDGGFVSFQAAYPKLCENRTWKFPGLTALSQPCLPTISCGPTRILPFLYLGSEEDAHNRELLNNHSITYELNVSNKCPKPDFISDGHFMRIPVNDSNNEKLLPYFHQTFQFIEKVREANECALVHCLAGISRSPTVAIAYVMRHLGMTCEEAYRYVKSKRATISPNFNFLGQLLEYEQQLISENILTKNPSSSSSCPPPTQSVSADYFVGGQAVFTAPTSLLTSKSAARRLNLSLRLSPYSSSVDSCSPNDVSPTTAMAKLQFDKPYGKENRSSTAGTSASAFTASSLTSVGMCMQRPTRLVMEQNVSSIKEEEVGQWESVSKSVMKDSLSLSISAGMKTRKSAFDQMSSSFTGSKGSQWRTEIKDAMQLCDTTQLSANSKKCRIHKFTIERDSDDSKSVPAASPVDQPEASVCATSCSDPWIGLPLESGGETTGTRTSLECPSRDYVRSDSVSTSGVGSEFSDVDLGASGCWEGSESSNFQDDGVFSDTGQLSAKPLNTRQLQLWSSDSGHWSSADEGLYSSCNSSAVEVPSVDAKSPEKRKYREPIQTKLSDQPSSREKRRSYAGPNDTDWSLELGARPKRWSLSEENKESCGDVIDGVNEQGIHLCADGSSSESSSPSSSRSSSSELNLSHRWLNMLQSRHTHCCKTRGYGLYRVQSCPSSISGHTDQLEPKNQVPESPPEPISDSALLKWRACHNRNQLVGATENVRNNSFGHGCCSTLKADELWRKLQELHGARRNESHSSSSTLASSSFSIVVQ